MRNFIIFSIIILCFSCKKETAIDDYSEKPIIENNSEDSLQQIKPLADFKEIDKLLQDLAPEIQIFKVSSTKETVIIGKRGTVIYVNPKNLKTSDGSKLASIIEVELVEMLDKKDLILNQARTISDGKLLVSGGAYYINMKSNGKNLILNKNGLKVEFPKITESEMSLFLGVRDSLNQMNWKEINQKFKIKNIEKPFEPKNVVFKEENRVIESELIDYEKPDFFIDDSIEINEPEVVYEKSSTKKEYQQYLKDIEEFKRKKKEYEVKKKTYQAVKLLNFGWINCDRFSNYSSYSKTNINFILNDDNIENAKFFLIIKNINSMIQTLYSKSWNQQILFENIPKGLEVTIVGLSAKDGKSFYFEKSFKVEDEQEVNVVFDEVSQKEIENNLEKLK